MEKDVFKVEEGHLMSTRALSPREEEIVELSVQGLTNDAIADKLGLSVGTVNTYWLRIRLKVGGAGRTDTVAKVITERAESALREANVERHEFATMIASKEQAVLDLRAALALLRLAMEKIRSTVWAADKDLAVYVVANGEMPALHNGVSWDTVKTIYQIFQSNDPEDPPIKAHIQALLGNETSVRLAAPYENMVLRVIPLRDELEQIMGCISILNAMGGPEEEH
jgi:DNA-binding CsgD family transcriptional regulator